MTVRSSTRPSRSRFTHLKSATALGGSIAALLLVAGPAAAQDECGANPGQDVTVICSTDGNPYSDGITYVTAAGEDVDVTLEDGVSVQADGAATPGVSITSGGSATLTGPNAVISTSGDNSAAVTVSTFGDQGGPITIDVGDIATSGNLSQGVRAVGAIDQDIDITTATVTTTGTADGGSFVFLPNSTGIYAAGSGTGNVSVTSDSVSTVAGGAYGIYAANSFGSGDVTVSATSVATTGDNADAINAQSGTGDVSVTTTGAITTEGASADGINAFAPGGSIAIDVSNAGITTSGNFDANGIITFASEGTTTIDFSSVQVTGGGTFSDGITASSSTGDISISGSRVTTNSTSAAAINALSTDGDIDIATDGNVIASGRGGSGIYAASTTGDVSVTANNVVSVAELADDTTTTRAAIFAQGANATVVATGVVTGSGSAEFGGTADAVAANALAGDASVTVNVVNKTGAGSALSSTATGNAAATVNGALSSEAAGTSAVTVLGGDTASVTIGSNGSIDSGGNLITVTSVNGTTVTNAGDLGDSDNGFAIEAIGGPATIVNSGQLSSRILLTAGNDSITNSGTFIADANPDFGGGTDSFVNNGTVLVRSNSATAGTVTFTGLESFTNAGLIDIANDTVGQTLILPGSYVGNGGQLSVDISADGTASDLLVVGGAATGSTGVLFNRAPGANPLLGTGSAVVVDAGAGTSAGAFFADPSTRDAGFIRYGLVFDAATNDFVLSGAPNPAAARTLQYVEGIRSLWLVSADAVSAQLRARRDAIWQYPDGGPGGRTWLHIYGQVENRDANRTDTVFGQTITSELDYDQDYFGGQVGLDLGGGSGERGGFAFGVTGGYLTSKQTFSGSDGISYDVANVGLYGSFSSGNFFANAIGKYDHYWANIDLLNGGSRFKTDDDVWGVRGEVGMRFGGESFYVEPAASLSYVNNSIEDISILGTTASFDDDEGLRARFGGRVGGILPLFGAKAAFYAGGNYVHEFRGEDRVVFSQGGTAVALTNDAIDDYGEALLGIEIGQPEGVSGFFEGTYRRTFDDNDDAFTTEGAGGRAGIRVRF